MTKNPKLFISQHFDSLIREVDIFTEKRLARSDLDKIVEVNDYDDFETTPPKNETFPEQIDDVMDFEGVVDFGKHAERKIWKYFQRTCFDFKRNLVTTIEEEPRRVKISDYWNEFREKMIDELNLQQKEAFERYETIRDDLKRENSSNKDIESIISRVFENNFAFILNYEDYQTIHLIELDFYLSPYECQLLR